MNYQWVIWIGLKAWNAWVHVYGVVDFLVNLLNYFMCSLLHAMHFLLVAAVKRANQVSVEQTAHNCVRRMNDSPETEASSSSSSLFYSLADRIRSTQFCVVTNTHNPMKTGHRRINTKPTLVSDETNVHSQDPTHATEQI